MLSVNHQKRNKISTVDIENTTKLVLLTIKLRTQQNYSTVIITKTAERILLLTSKTPQNSTANLPGHGLCRCTPFSDSATWRLSMDAHGHGGNFGIFTLAVVRGYFDGPVARQGFLSVIFIIEMCAIQYITFTEPLSQ